MTFEEHVAREFRDKLQDLDSRVSAELGEAHGRVILHLCNHARTLTDEQCRKFWLAIVEEMALPRFMKD